MRSGVVQTQRRKSGLTISRRRSLHAAAHRKTVAASERATISSRSSVGRLPVADVSVCARRHRWCDAMVLALGVAEDPREPAVAGLFMEEATAGFWIEYMSNPHRFLVR